MDNNKYTALRNLLLSTLPEEHQNVYFQPPNGEEMKYPCIIYDYDTPDKTHANDVPYNITTQFKVTIIDPNKDSSVLEKFQKLPMTSWVNNYEADGLYHYIQNIYF